MEYDDGASTLFFYTKGKKGSVTEGVRKLLHYMEESSEKNADSTELKEIHQMVETVRHDEEVSLEYMKVYEREQMIREQGEAIGEAKGEAQVVGIVRKMREMMSAEKIAEITGMDQKKVEKITDFLGKYPRESNEEIAVRLISQEDVGERYGSVN